MTESVLRVIPSAEDQSRGSLWWRGRGYPCALGREGVLPAAHKREGDGASPAGLYPLLGLYYRADRLDWAKPGPQAAAQTGLPAQAIGADLAWCDDPECADYNSAVTLPHSGSSENLRRSDGLYDLLVITGHNQHPAIAGWGSAIFLHIARDDFPPTRGCVAIARNVLLDLAPQFTLRTMIRIHGP